MKIPNLLFAACAAALTTAVASALTPRHTASPATAVATVYSADTLPGMEHGRLPGEVAPDDTPFKGTPYKGTPIQLMARTYGDSIVLRWAPSGYAAWHYLNRTGYNIYRYDCRRHCDTLAIALKPKTLDEFRATYAEDDSIARVGYGLIYGDNLKKPSQTREEPGSMGSMLEIYDDQVAGLAFAVLASEWRQDLAEDMAMRFVDHNVAKGERYEYIVQPAMADTTGTMPIVGAQVRGVENVAHRADAYMPCLRDSVSEKLTVTLFWNDRTHSSFEIERRVHGSRQWERVNRRTYLPMFKPGIEGQDEEVMYADRVPHAGTYEYRILAHDAFGDTTEPSPALTVKVGDTIPPAAPIVTAINIMRPEKDNPTAKILAGITWHKDSMEHDFAGYMPLYYNERFTGREWKPLCRQLLSPADTAATVDVTGLATGMLVVAAYDEAGNVGYSLPVQLRISDMKAPGAPTNLRAETDNGNGTISLRWNRPDDDDVAYYELAFANDTTHHFIMRNQGQILDTMFVDTVHMAVNQRYIYYKVRAVDYSNNTGEYSGILQVERPHATPPTTAHLDSAWVDREGIHMNWVTGLDADMYCHRIFRRLDGAATWSLIAIVAADDVLKTSANGVMQITDCPPADNSRRYEYAVVSYNRSGIASEPSLVYSARFADLADADLGIKLIGDYDTRRKQSRLSWEHNAVDAAASPFRYCIYRRADGDTRFRFIMTSPSSSPVHYDYLLHPGETAEYYVVIRFEDGRRSLKSNTVSISAPKEKEK